MTDDPGTPAVASDTAFVGSIPDVYERLMVPLVFAQPAAYLADAVAELRPSDVLETAAGTGVVTRALLERIPSALITATDLNTEMLNEARSRTADTSAIRWQQANALDLDFEEGTFDAVVCQFGVMFFPDRAAGYAEARRVLRPGGTFLFNVWGSVDDNDIPRVIADALAAAAPDSPPDFFRRTPYGYFDQDQLTTDLRAGGLSSEIEVCDGVNRGTALDAATAFCQGTPLRAELDAHPVLDAGTATTIAAEALEREFGDGVIEGRARWLQVVARPL